MKVLIERVFANALFDFQGVTSSLPHLPCTELTCKALTMPDKLIFLKDVVRFACFASLESF